MSHSKSIMVANNYDIGEIFENGHLMENMNGYVYVYIENDDFYTLNEKNSSELYDILYNVKDSDMQSPTKHEMFENGDELTVKIIKRNHQYILFKHEVLFAPERQEHMRIYTYDSLSDLLLSQPDYHKRVIVSICDFETK